MAQSCWIFGWFIVATALCGLGCTNSTAGQTSGPAQATHVPLTATVGDASRGLDAIKRFECVRCHEGLLGIEPAPPEKQCVGCHRRITAGNYAAPPGVLGRWQRDLRHLVDVPTLVQSTVRIRASFLRRFLRAPDDIRPSLEDRMPILPLTERDAADIAALLGGPDDTTTPATGDIARGQSLFSTKGCSNCHAVGNAVRPAVVALPVIVAKDALLRGIKLAPDLGFAKQRTTTRGLRAWLQQPSAVKPDSAMPDIPMTTTELEDLVTYIESLVPAAPSDRPFVRQRLNRPIRYAEIERRILRQGCWHCHSDPDFAYGDGGPGNTGGFGYAGRSVVLSNWEGLHGGYVGPDGQRHSLLYAGAGQVPRLLQSLVARREEEAGRRVDGVLGMPLGLPSLSNADMSLVADWLEQGAILEP